MLRKNGFPMAVAVGLVAAAVAQELRKPAGERTWTGKVAGFVPYDLRRPTLQRVIAEYWSPDDPRILMPHGFGVGWGINVGRLVRLASQVTAG
jgi:Family of unknown function (DUF5808)